ncbi:unnamed protein product [Victoria cruziana]
MTPWFTRPAGWREEREREGGPILRLPPRLLPPSFLFVRVFHRLLIFFLYSRGLFLISLPPTVHAHSSDFVFNLFDSSSFWKGIPLLYSCAPSLVSLLVDSIGIWKRSGKEERLPAESEGEELHQGKNISGLSGRNLSRAVDLFDIHC